MKLLEIRLLWKDRVRIVPGASPNIFLNYESSKEGNKPASQGEHSKPEYPHTISKK